MDLEIGREVVLLDSSGSGQRPVADCCEHSNEPSGYIKGREILDYLSDY
jgi:hypothetical protein